MGMARWSWLRLTAILVATAGLGGVAWWLRQIALPTESVIENMTRPSLPKRRPWPTDIGAFAFADPNIRTIASECDALARREYSDLLHDNYSDIKRDVKPEAIVARWYVAEDRGCPIPVPITRSPARSASIHSKQDRMSRIRDVTMIGACRSAVGWTASVQYHVVRDNWYFIHISRPPDGRRYIDLVNPSLQTGTTQSRARSITVTLESSLFTSADLAQQHDSGTAIAPFFRSAESLRDESLRRFDMLEAKVGEQIRSGSGFTETDWSNVRSDNPPYTSHRPTGPLAKDEEQICLQRATEILDQRRALIREHYRLIYEVVVDAFPFFVVIDQASEPGNES